MKITDLSKKTGVSQRMLRYFEQQGLLAPSRGDNDYRTYNHDDEEKVKQICQWQRMGFTLKEVNQLFKKPKDIDKIIDEVYQRERSHYLQKQTAVEELRFKLTGQKFPYFEERICYSIPSLDNVLDALEGEGFICQTVDFVRFSEVNFAHEQGWQIGEILHQSAFYLVAGDPLETNNFAAKFMKFAQKEWSVFDGHPPQEVQSEDLNLFFSQSEIFIYMPFKTTKGELILALPYNSIFAVAKSLAEKP